MIKIEDYASPAELRRLASTLLVVVLGITLFALFACIVVPGLRNANKPRAVAVERPHGETGWLDPGEYPPARGYEVPPVDPATVLTATSELLSLGESLYGRNCEACHGAGGGGDGPAARGLAPPARDFTRGDGWKQGDGRAGIYETLTRGVPGGAMSAFDYLSPRDRMALVHYVRSLGSFPRQAEDQATLDALAAGFASAGGRVPNRIPVSSAIAKLEAESAGIRPLPVAAAGPGSMLARTVHDPVCAGLVLAGERQDETELAALIVPGVPGNGFSVSVLTWTPQQWRELQGELSRIER
jgi:mono/diheme cytochrome c family protein